MDTARQPGISISQIFLESAHFEHREDFLSFPPATPMELEMDVGLEATIATDGSRGRIRLIVKSKEGNDDLYRVALTMTGLIEVDRANSNLPLAQYAPANSWGLLYPFAREAVANLTGRGRFGPVYLKPMNFIAMAGQGVAFATEPNAAVAVTKDK